MKPLATLYLDKPMLGHTLMQAIARVNRRAPGKKNGLIIDYNGMLKSLRAALATFAQKRDAGLGDAEVDPLREPEQGMELEYAASIARVRAHLLEHGFSLQDLVDAQARDFEISTQLHKAREALSATAEVKKTFEVLAQDVEERRLNLFPHECLARHSAEEAAIAAIYNLLQKRGPPLDVTQVLRGLQTVVDSALALQPQAQVRSGSYDLSTIDFVRRQSEFAQTQYKQTEMLTLQEKIKAVAKELLEKLLAARNQLQYLRDRAALQAQMKTEIFDYLFDQLPEAAYGQDEILSRSQRVFEHFYRRQIDGQTVH